MAGIWEAFQAWSTDPIAARRRFQALAADGDPRAQCAFGLMLSSGRGGGTDPVAAARWLQRAAEQGHPLACYSLGAAYAEGRGVPADADVALQWYSRAAELGDREAMHALGMLCSADGASPEDLERAVAWWRWAAARGVPASMRSLGDALAATDLPGAAAWWLDAALAGDEPAVEALARVLPSVRAAAETSGAAAWVAAAFADDPAERDRLRAVAVRLGDGRACFDEADRVRRGEAPGGDAARFGLLARAAAAGHDLAEHELANAHASGVGAIRDVEAAAEGFRRAAANGRPSSWCGLGLVLIELGEPEAALDALRQAALGGHTAAMVVYAARVAEDDRVEALRWLLEAHAAEHPDALEVARALAATLTPDEIRAADRRTLTDGAAAQALLEGRS